MFKSRWLLTSAGSISRAERFLLTGQTHCRGKHEQMARWTQLAAVQALLWRVVRRFVCLYWDGCLYTRKPYTITPFNNMYTWGIKLTKEIGEHVKINTDTEGKMYSLHFHYIILCTPSKNYNLNFISCTHCQKETFFSPFLSLPQDHASARTARTHAHTRTLPCH